MGAAQNRRALSLESVLPFLTEEYTIEVSPLGPSALLTEHAHERLLAADSSPGAVAFRRRRAGNKERGGWWLGSVTRAKGPQYHGHRTPTREGRPGARQE